MLPNEVPPMRNKHTGTSIQLGIWMTTMIAGCDCVSAAPDTVILATGGSVGDDDTAAGGV